MFEVIRDALRARGIDIASAATLALWSIGSLLALLLASSDWQVFAVPLAGALLLQTVPWVRRHREAFAIVTLGAVVALVTLESGIRLRSFGPDALARPADYGPYSGISAIVRPLDDPALGFGLVPGFRGRYQGRELAINAQGFRGEDFRESRDAGTLRVLAFGSSITMGAGVDIADAYPGATARALTSKGLPAEAYDFGVPAYTTPQMLDLAMRAGPRYHPDAVILELTSNGLREGARARDAAIAAARSDSRDVSSVERFSFAATAIYPPADLRARLKQILIRSPAPQADDDVLPEVERRLGDLVALGRREGFAVYVVLIRPMIDFERDDLDRDMREALRGRIASTGAILVDTYPLFRAGDLADDFIIFPGDLHPNARAHARIAEALAEEIATRTKR